MKSAPLALAIVVIIFGVDAARAQTNQPGMRPVLNGQLVSGARWEAPVDPDATPGVCRLLAEMDALSGQATLTGQHNFPNDGSRWSDRVLELTEDFPEIFGEDFGFSGSEDKDFTLSRPALLAPWQPFPTTHTPDSKEQAK